MGSNLTTVYGQFDPNTGLIRFGQPPCWDGVPGVNHDVVGCLLVSGEHAGLVKVEITDAAEAELEDTFYGCFNPKLGVFEVELPILPPCEHCFEDGYETPSTAFVTISGAEDKVNNADCDEAFDGVYELVRSESDECVWEIGYWGPWVETPHPSELPSGMCLVVDWGEDNDKDYRVILGIRITRQADNLIIKIRTGIWVEAPDPETSAWLIEHDMTCSSSASECIEASYSPCEDSTMKFDDINVSAEEEEE